jgi:MFS family permease
MGGIPFLVLWAGQAVSVIGTGLTTFALSVWVYQETGSVTQFALINVLSSAPLLFLSPLAGGLVDRWDRRRTMLVADLVSCMAVLGLYLLFVTGNLAIWHIYVASVVAALAGAFHWPAYAAASTLMVAKRHLGRAAGMAEFARAASVAVSPLLGGALVIGAGLAAVLVVDCVTFLVAAVCLLVVTVPSPEPAPHGSLLADVRVGWRYLSARPGLLRLLAQFAMMNLLCSFVPVLMIPLALSATSAASLGLTVTLATCGFLVGGVVMSVWGGPEQRVRAIVLCALAQGAAMIVTGMRPSVVLIVVGLFCFHFLIPVINGCSQAIWQVKVPPALQGRAFAIRRMLAQATSPVGYLLAGPLADHVFVPRFGDDRGVGVLFVVLGVVCLAGNLLALRSRQLRHVERDLPDTRVSTAAR